MNAGFPRHLTLLVPQIIGGASIWLDALLVFLVPVYVWAAPPGHVAFIALCLGIAPLLAGPLIGRWVDRVSVGPALWLGLGLRLVGTLGLALAANIEVFLAWVVFKGLGNSLYFSSFAVVANRLVPEDERMRYYSSFSVADQACKLGVPPLAGGLMLLWPAQALFFISAMLLAATVPSIYAIQRWLGRTGLGRPSIATGDGTPGESLSTALLGTCAFGILLSTTLALYDPHLAGYIHSLGQPPLLFSIIVTATAAGALIAALLARTQARYLPPARLRLYGAGVFGLAVVLAAGLATQGQIGFASGALLWLLNGFGYEWMVISSAVLLQSQAPPARIATITTTLRSLQLLCMMGAPSLGATLIERASPSAPFLIAAACTVPLVLLAAWLMLDVDRQGPASVEVLEDR